MKMKHHLITTALAFLVLAGPVQADDLTATLLADQAPKDAKTVVEARKGAQPGQPLVVTGRIGGVVKPLSEAAAIAVLVDASVKSCSDIPGDTCATPWDYCCEAPESLRASTLTIQVRDENGNIVRQSLRGVGGLEELSNVTVKGIVDKTSTDEAVLLNIDKIYVAPEVPKE